MQGGRRKKFHEGREKGYHEKGRQTSYEGDTVGDKLTRDRRTWDDHETEETGKDLLVEVRRSGKKVYERVGGGYVQGKWRSVGPHS